MSFPTLHRAELTLPAEATQFGICWRLQLPGWPLGSADEAKQHSFSDYDILDLETGICVRYMHVCYFT